MMTGSLNLLKEQSERAWGKAKDSRLSEEEWKNLGNDDISLDSQNNNDTKENEEVE
jgi:hypothetical protein